MESILRRPFYTEFAWAYDLIIESPISSRCDFVEDVLSQRGVLSGSKILDAGCGTGSYSIELARRGYIVTGLDISTELISEAKKKSGDNPLPLTFEVGDVLKLSSAPKFDGILCRSVLNDMTDDISRQGAFFSFARALRKGGFAFATVAVRMAHRPTVMRPVAAACTACIATVVQKRQLPASYAAIPGAEHTKQFDKDRGLC